MKNQIVWVEGIIGAGKSSLTEELARRLAFKPMYEEVADGDDGILRAFYADPQKMAFAMQIYMLHSRYAQHQVAAHGLRWSGYVMDRSLPGDCVFAELHAKYGNITRPEMDVYRSAYATMSLTLHPPAWLIWLDIAPELAMDRIRGRGRGVESGISLGYLQDLRGGYLSLISEIVEGSHPWARGCRVAFVQSDGQSVADLAEAAILGMKP
jgi:deoxyadenosine/deoxycytidine kinase